MVTKNGSNILKGYEILIPPTQPAVYTARKLAALTSEHPEFVIDVPEPDQELKQNLQKMQFEMIESKRKGDVK